MYTFCNTPNRKQFTRHQMAINHFHVNKNGKHKEMNPSYPTLVKVTSLVEPSGVF